MKRKWMIGVLAICLLVAGCKAEQPPTLPKEETKHTIPEKEYRFVEDGEARYYIEGREIYRETLQDEQKTKIVQESTDIYKLKLQQDRLMYLAVKDDFVFSLVSVNKDGTQKKVLVSNEDFAQRTDLQIIDWEIYKDTLYVQLNFPFYKVEGEGRTPEKLHEDVGTYAIYDDHLFFIEHSQRTFTLYKMNLATGEKERLVGKGFYQEDKTESSQLCSNFVIAEDGTIFYTMRVPYGLWRLDGEESCLVDEGEEIDEYSMMLEQNKLFYIKKQGDKFALIAYDPLSDTKEQRAEISDYSDALAIKNDYFYYEDSSNTVCKVKI